MRIKICRKHANVFSNLTQHIFTKLSNPNANIHAVSYYKTKFKKSVSEREAEMLNVSNSHRFNYRSDYELKSKKK